MHKLILFLALFLSALPNLQAQNQENRLLIEEYLQQSEKQKKAGITMIAVGAASAGLGLLLAATSYSWDTGAAFGGGVILFVGGSAAVIIGVPIIISSASKARKAAQLSIGTNSARVVQQHGNYSTFYPALNISFPINSAKR